MRESIKFLHYAFLPDDEIPVDWNVILPRHINLTALIVDADCEPEDPQVRVGVLTAPWFEHEPGCVLISRGKLNANRRFALSEQPLDFVAERLAA